MEDKFSFQVLNEDQQEGGEPTRWVVRCESNEDMQAWITAIARVASIRSVLRVGEENSVGKSDDEVSQDAQMEGTEQATLVAKPQGTAAVLQRVFGQDAGAKAAQSMQRHNQILLPKVAGQCCALQTLFCTVM
eukprot:COSAG05_NODE_870_length_6849_cov_43.750519_1_plen_133_part_00